MRRATALRAMAATKFELSDNYAEMTKAAAEQVYRYQKLTHKYNNEAKQCLSDAKKLEKKARQKKAQQKNAHQKNAQQKSAPQAAAKWSTEECTSEEGTAGEAASGVWEFDGLAPAWFGRPTHCAHFFFVEDVHAQQNEARRLEEVVDALSLCTRLKKNHVGSMLHISITM